MALPKRGARDSCQTYKIRMHFQIRSKYLVSSSTWTSGTLESLILGHVKCEGLRYNKRFFIDKEFTNI